MAVILIVEDDVFIREIAEMMIQDWGHQNSRASDVDEALSLLRSPQHIDALFTDIYLKRAVLGGCDLAHQAIALRPKLRVLYTTGNFITDKMKALFVEGTHIPSQAVHAAPAPRLRRRHARGVILTLRNHWGTTAMADLFTEQSRVRYCRERHCRDRAQRAHRSRQKSESSPPPIARSTRRFAPAPARPRDVISTTSETGSGISRRCAPCSRA